MTLPELLRERREKAGLSQAQAAKRLHVTKAALSMYENGKRGIPLDIAEAMAKLYSEQEEKNQ